MEKRFLTRPAAKWKQQRKAPAQRSAGGHGEAPRLRRDGSGLTSCPAPGRPQSRERGGSRGSRCSTVLGQERDLAGLPSALVTGLGSLSTRGFPQTARRLPSPPDPARIDFPPWLVEEPRNRIPPYPPVPVPRSHATHALCSWATYLTPARFPTLPPLSGRAGRGAGAGARGRAGRRGCLARAPLLLPRALGHRVGAVPTPCRAHSPLLAVLAFARPCERRRTWAQPSPPFSQQRGYSSPQRRIHGTCPTLRGIRHSLRGVDSPDVHRITGS